MAPSFQYCLLEQINSHFLVAIRIPARHIIIIRLSVEYPSFRIVSGRKSDIGSVYLFLSSKKESNVGTMLITMRVI